MDGDLGDDVALDLGDIHVRGVLEVSGESVVLADEGIEDIGEVDVGVLITGVDTAVLRTNKEQCQVPIKPGSVVCIRVSPIFNLGT